MKKCSFITLGLLFCVNLFAQDRAEKLLLQPGQKLTLLSLDTVQNSQKRGEQTMDMKTISQSRTEYTLLDKTDQGYRFTAVLQKMVVDFDGFGQKMIYDSEDPKKQEGMMAEQIKGMIGKADTITLTLQGKLVEGEDDDKDKGKGKGGGRRMMRTFDQKGAQIEHAFLLVPKEAGEGNGWKADQTRDGVKSQTIYFVDKISGNMAEVSFKKKTKGTRTVKSQQGEMLMEIDNLSSGNLTVDLRSGLVKTFSEDQQSSTKMNVMGQDMPSSGTTRTRITFE